MGRVAWITGVTKGLGREMAAGLAGRGWTIAGCGRSAGKLAELEADFGGEHHFSAADVGQDEEARAFCERAFEETGAPDLLVNNAALMNTPAPLWEVPAGEFDALMQVNVCGIANLIRHAVPLMIEQGSGIIVNFSSGWGRSTSPEVAPYCTTKWAVEGLTSALAQELPRGLAAVALNPGIIDTDMLRKSWGEGAGAYGSAAEWASRAVPFLEKLRASDNGGALTVP